MAMTASVSNGFINPSSFGLSRQSSSSTLSMVLEKPREKKLAKIEVLKTQSSHLIQPLKDVSSSVLLLCRRLTIDFSQSSYICDFIQTKCSLK